MNLMQFKDLHKILSIYLNMLMTMCVLGALVVSSYAPCPDVHQVITPDLKAPGSSCLLLVDLSGRARLGGSALAQCFSQLGDVSPDVDDPQLFKRAFATTQTLIAGQCTVNVLVCSY